MTGFLSAMRHAGKQAVYVFADVSGLDRLLLSFIRRNHLRILTYHGVCPDEYSAESWIPPHFVPISEFERQIKFLIQYMRPIHLHEAINVFRSRREFPHKGVVVTFDDGYENNLAFALPVLEKYRVPATIFLSTKWIDDEFFPFDRLRLLATRTWRDKGGPHEPALPSYKKAPIHEVLTWLSEEWPSYVRHIAPAERIMLKPLSWENISSVNSDLVRFGAHTHHHAILANETREFRRDEVFSSVEIVQEKTGLREIAFCYPNGQLGDFDEEDKRTVQKAGCYCALSSRTGSNGPRADLYELQRYTVGLFHDQRSFLAELSGFRSSFRFWTGREMGMDHKQLGYIEARSFPRRKST